jgi:pimeloyl-ACP methyl ester carboxylesterase
MTGVQRMGVGLVVLAGMLVATLLPAHADEKPVSISGECGTGAVVPWAGKLWVITYGPHLPFGSSDKLYEISPDLQQTVRPESVGGTPANRMIHRESQQLFIGPYIIDVWPADKPKPSLEQANSIADSLYGGKDVKAFAESGMSLGRLEVKPGDLMKCKAPSLFIYGDKEGDATKDSVATARRLIPESEIQVIRGGTHITTPSFPEFGKAIVKFLTQHRSERV